MKIRFPILILAASVFSISTFIAFQKESINQAHYWKAELLWLDLGVQTFEKYRSWQQMSIWGIYQNPEAIVRYERESSIPPASISTDTSIIDYRNGIVLSPYRGQTTAVRSKLTQIERNPSMPQSAPLGQLIISGQKCNGIRNRMQDPINKETEERETWVVEESGFRIPLLEIRRRAGIDGKPHSMTVKVITCLERVEALDPSLFKLPAGYNVTEVKPASSGPSN